MVTFSIKTSSCKRKPKHDHDCAVGFVCEVSAFFWEVVSGDVDGVKPTHMCHKRFGVDACEGGTEWRLLIFSCDAGWRSKVVLSVMKGITVSFDLSRKARVCVC